MKLLPIAEYLQSEGVGIMAKSIFINSMPANVKLGVLLKEPFAGTEIDHELPGYRKAVFQVVVRARDYAAGETLIQKVSDTLTLQEIAMNGLQMKYLRPITEPVSYPITEGNEMEFSVNFDSCYVLV